MSFFSERVIARFCKSEIENIDLLVKNNKDLYENRSQFLRCAAIRLINDHKTKVVV